MANNARKGIFVTGTKVSSQSSPSLGEAIGIEARFVEAVVLDAEYPARFDEFCAFGSRDDCPGLSFIKTLQALIA
jgi:hypothetical protein